VGIATSLLAERAASYAQGRAVARGEVRLEAILQGIRDGERLFRNLAFEHVTDYRFVLPRSKWSDKVDYVLNQHSEIRLVMQGELYYQGTVRKGQAIISGPFDKREYLGYDGQVYRFKIQSGSPTEGHANIWTGPMPKQAGTLNPQRMGRPQHYYNLSEILDGSHLKDKNDNITTQEVRFVGSEIVNGIQCVKLNLVSKVGGEDSKPRIGTEVIWLAREWLYLPVKFEAYDSYYKINHPYVAVEATDWREIEPGIVIPFKAEKKVYHDDSLVKGEILLANTETTTVTHVSLNPNYDISLFRDIPFPPGMTVYVVKDGNILDSYVVGEESHPAGASWSWKLVGLTLIALMVICGGACWALLRVRYRKKSGSAVASETPPR
jgi:hypothetical protein